LAKVRELWNRLFGGHDVFISYSSRDEAWAVALEKLLKLGRYRVFRDDSSLQTGDHLDRILNEVRRSTMLFVLVSDAAVRSDWVHRELMAHLERPQRRWRVAPVFLDGRYPAELPERFKILGDFHGLRLPTEGVTPVELQTHRSFLRDATSKFIAIRKTTALAIAVLLTLTAVLGIVLAQAWLGHRNAQRDAWLKRAEVHIASSRFVDAEAALAQAWLLDPSAATLATYREVRAHRALERPTRVDVLPTDTVLAVDAGSAGPYMVVHSGDERRALHLLSEGLRRELEPDCAGTPRIATLGQSLVWTCGSRLGTVAVAPGRLDPMRVDLPESAVALRIRDGGVDVLFRSGPLSLLGRYALPHPLATSAAPLKGAPEAGEMGFCGPESDRVWSVAPSEGRLDVRMWDGAGAPVVSEAVVVPEPSGAGRVSVAWVASVSAAPDCDRLFAEFAIFTLAEKSSFEMVRLRPGSSRAVDRFDRSVTEIAAVNESSGVEAVYLTKSRDLRAFVLTSPVVLTTQVRTLASGIERFSSWSTEGGEAWTLAAGSDSMLVFRNQTLWARYPPAPGETFRVVRAPDAAWIAVQSTGGTVLWKRSGPCACDTAVPSPQAVAAETALP
jgi:hypothetical protein